MCLLCFFRRKNMVESFFNSIKFFVIFVAVGIGITLIIVAIKYISEHADERARKEQAVEEEKRYNERKRINEIELEKRRDSYWQNLSLVYGDKDRDTLVEVLEWLHEFQQLIQEDDPDMFAVRNRSECRENIKKILEYPQWLITEGETVDSPIWVDLDIKYVNLLLS